MKSKITHDGLPDFEFEDKPIWSNEMNYPISKTICCGCGIDLTFSSRIYIDNIPYCNKCWIKIERNKMKQNYCPHCGQKLEKP